MKSSFPLVFLRVVLGWLFFYAGITKVLDPAWSSKSYLLSAKTFTAFYAWLANPDVLPFIDFINKWSLTLLGVSLILGIFVRLSSRLGAALMLLYYFPILTFPYVGHGFLVDEHIIYIAALILLGEMRAGRSFGLEPWCSNLPICKRYPKLRNLLG